MHLITGKKKPEREKPLRINLLRHLGVTILLAALLATVFTAWNPYHEDQLTLFERYPRSFHLIQDQGLVHTQLPLLSPAPPLASSPDIRVKAAALSALMV